MTKGKRIKVGTTINLPLECDKGEEEIKSTKNENLPLKYDVLSLFLRNLT